MNMNENLIINWYKTIDSTNLQAMRDKDIATDRTVWAAEYQTAGRGQRGNKWLGEKSMNLAFSILFKPNNLKASEQFKISMISALGVCEYLKEYGVDAKIKWPNDIYVGDKKICGMLIENSIVADRLSLSVSGIGININQRSFDPTLPNPTSLSLVLNKTDKSDLFDLKEELIKVLRHIFYLYDNMYLLKEKYLSRLYRLEGYYKYEEIPEMDALIPNTFAAIPSECKGKIIEACIEGVDSNGCIILKTKDGEVKTYAFKEIKYIL